MSDAKDPEIKLFGKTIPVREQAAVAFSDGASAPDPSSSGSPPGEDQTAAVSSPEDGYSMNGLHEDRIPEKESLGEDSIETPHGDEGMAFARKQGTDSERTSVLNEILPLKPEEEQSEASISQDKPLKKPDKILPCPRCNSMETKFCYYNNYNVNQPRHFCKNCQRYWTAGGSMRNVPVGAGRRKNKNLASHYRPITVSEAIQNVRNNESVKTNGTILAFGDTPLCESMASAMSLTDKSSLWNGFPKPEEPTNHRHLSESVITDSMEDKRGSQDKVLPSFNGFNPQLHCLPGAPWPYPWNAAPIYPTGFYQSPPLWGCSMPIPWLSEPSPIPGPNSSNLGKHSRDVDSNSDSNSNSNSHKQEGEQKNSEKHFWIPKSLRIDDMEEVAKSSIWEKLGILNGTPSSKSEGRFAAFNSNDESDRLTKNLCANPVALSGSQEFQEMS